MSVTPCADASIVVRQSQSLARWKKSKKFAVGGIWIVKKKLPQKSALCIKESDRRRIINYFFSLHIPVCETYLCWDTKPADKRSPSILEDTRGRHCVCCPSWGYPNICWVSFVTSLDDWGWCKHWPHFAPRSIIWRPLLMSWLSSQAKNHLDHQIFNSSIPAPVRTINQLWEEESSRFVSSFRQYLFGSNIIVVVNTNFLEMCTFCVSKHLTFLEVLIVQQHWEAVGFLFFVSSLSFLLDSMAVLECNVLLLSRRLLTYIFFSSVPIIFAHTDWVFVRGTGKLSIWYFLYGIVMRIEISCSGGHNRCSQSRHEAYSLETCNNLGWIAEWSSILWW